MKKIILSFALLAFIAGPSLAITTPSSVEYAITQNDGDPKKKKEKKKEESKEARTEEGEKMEKKSCSPKQGKPCCAHGKKSS